jgi:hypothetical protein
VSERASAQAQDRSFAYRRRVDEACVCVARPRTGHMTRPPASAGAVWRLNGPAGCGQVHRPPSMSWNSSSRTSGAKATHAGAPSCTERHAIAPAPGWPSAKPPDAVQIRSRQRCARLGRRQSGAVDRSIRRCCAVRSSLELQMTVHGRTANSALDCAGADESGSQLDNVSTPPCLERSGALQDQPSFTRF